MEKEAGAKKKKKRRWFIKNLKYIYKYKNFIKIILDYNILMYSSFKMLKIIAKHL